MWKGNLADELISLYDMYYEKYGCEPDWYEEVNYEMLSDKEYAACIRKALSEGKELPDVL